MHYRAFFPFYDHELSHSQILFKVLLPHIKQSGMLFSGMKPPRKSAEWLIKI